MASFVGAKPASVRHFDEVNFLMNIYEQKDCLIISDDCTLDSRCDDIMQSCTHRIAVRKTSNCNSILVLVLNIVNLGWKKRINHIHYK